MKKQCATEDCSQPSWAKGLCRKHYLRKDRAENPERWKAYDQKYKERNRERIRTQARERYRNDPHGAETAWRRVVKRKYGLTLEEYEAVIARGCAICGEHKPRMALDHDHTNGKIRDALCSSCNNGLGRFMDDPARLRAAAEYLERHR